MCQHIDLSLYDCLVAIHDDAVQCYPLSGGKDVPVQTKHDMPQNTLEGVFTASDGYLVIAAQVDDAWKRFAKLTDGEAFAADTRFHTSADRNEHRLEIRDLAKAWVTSQTVVQCLAALDAIGLPCAKVQNIDEVLADPQIIARNIVIEQTTRCWARSGCTTCRSGFRAVTRYRPVWRQRWASTTVTLLPAWALVQTRLRAWYVKACCIHQALEQCENNSVLHLFCES